MNTYVLSLCLMFVVLLCYLTALKAVLGPESVRIVKVVDEAQWREPPKTLVFHKGKTRLPKNTVMIVFPSMLGPETPQIQQKRLDAVIGTWVEQLAEPDRKRVFFVQWFGKEDVLAGPQLLRVPSGDHNATFVSRILWAYAQVVGKFDPDWIVKGDDVTYFLPHNLKALLDSKSASDVHFLGQRLLGPGMKRPFLSGGAGYAMSRPVIQTLMSAVAKQHPCITGSGGAEDTTIALCLDELGGIKAGDSSDHTGGDFFNAFCPLSLNHLRGGVYNLDDIQWFKDYRQPFGGVKTEKACCAEKTVSFHYVMPEHMRALHQAVYGDTWPTDFEPYRNPEQRKVLGEFLAPFRNE